MVRKAKRRGERVWVIDFSYTKPDGSKGRYRRDAEVQMQAAAQTEETARKMGATLFGDPTILCGPNGVPLRACDPAPAPCKEPAFHEVVARYLTEYAPSAMTPATRDGYRSKLRTHLLPRLGDLPVSEAFEVAKSREVDVALVESGASLSTRANVFLALRSVGKFAVEAKILEREPKYLPLPKRGKRVPTSPPREDVAVAVEAASCPEHRLVILLAAHAGLRKGEIRALRCKDVELENNRLVVRSSRYKQHEGTPKGKHERQIPLSKELREALIAARVHERPPEQEAALSTRGKPWGTEGPYQALQIMLRRVNLPRERLHALRAFFVTTLLRGHVPVHVVRELAGHQDLATTQGYAAILANDRGVAVDVLDRAHRGEDAAAVESSKRSVRTRRVRRVLRSTGRIRQLRARALGGVPRSAWPSVAA